MRACHSKQEIDNYDSVTDREVRIYSRGSWKDYRVTITPIISNGHRTIGKVIVLN